MQWKMLQEEMARHEKLQPEVWHPDEELPTRPIWEDDDSDPKPKILKALDICSGRNAPLSRTLKKMGLWS